jgi:hypothetical protein
MLCEFILSHWRDVLSAAFVGILIAVVGAIIAWLQLDYAKKRDAKLDSRSQWEKIHKAMMEFRFRREIINSPGPTSNYDGGVIVESRTIETAHALHMLRAELDRSPESPLVTSICEFLNANFGAQQ